MKLQHGEFTVGDVGVSITAAANVTLTGINLRFKFVKPSGATILRVASSVSGYNAVYTWASGDLDEAGQWRAFLYNVDTGFHYARETGNSFPVRPDPEDMAVG